MDINNILKNITFSDINEELKSAFNSLINLVEKLSSENRQLRKENQHLRDENNRLKGEQGKPDIKANTKDKKISLLKRNVKIILQPNQRRKTCKNKRHQN